ncbi:MAG: glycosyltransferase [Planctomycetota bacterium]|jgi:glycosyltransferase involved in cell wall biosynthesis
MNGPVGYVLRKFPVLSETFVLNEILALEARGVEVHIFPLAPTRDPRFHEGLGRLKATVHYVPGVGDLKTLLRHARRQARRKPKRFRREFLRALATCRPTVLWRFLQAAYVADRARRVGVRHLHAHFAGRPATVARQASHMLGTPFSFTAHAFDIYRGANPHVLADKMADACFTVTVSDYNVDYLRALANGKAPRLELVRNGIDMSRFAPPESPPEGRFKILAVARLVEKKGLPILIDACRQLRDRAREFECEIVGKGAQRAMLERLIREWELGDCVRLSGPVAQQEIVGRYHAAHVVALPCIVGDDGNRDGLPVSIVEALACGVPVISTPVTGIPEAVRDDVNGRLVPENDPAALAAAIEELMDDPEKLARLREGARSSVLAGFDETRTAARLHGLFEEVTT